MCIYRCHPWSLQTGFSKLNPGYLQANSICQPSTFHAQGSIIFIANLQNSFLKTIPAGAPKQHDQKTSALTITWALPTCATAEVQLYQQQNTTDTHPYPDSAAHTQSSGKRHRTQ